MPKQKSIFKLTGTIEGTSFYHSRNGGYQTRQLNPNMSERVKNDPEFENTRLHGREFGATGSLASAVVRGISDRWRYILTPIMVGKLTKTAKEMLIQNTIDPIGKREFLPATLPQLQNAFNRYLKNQLPPLWESYLESKINFDDALNRLNITESLYTSEELEQQWIHAGATGVRIELYVYRVTTPHYLESLGKYLPAVPTMDDTPLYQGDHALTGNGGTPILVQSGPYCENYPQNSTRIVGGAFFIVKPYRETGSQKQIMQSLCVAHWWSVPDAP